MANRAQSQRSDSIKETGTPEDWELPFTGQVISFLKASSNCLRIKLCSHSYNKFKLYSKSSICVEMEMVPIKSYITDSFLRGKPN